jgi:nucleoside-diphosphate-sugar epimerase
VTTIHLLGSEGFVGRALQREADQYKLHCWSHSSCNPENHFDLLDPSSWQTLFDQQPTHIILLSWPGLPNYHAPFHITRNLPACIELIDKLLGVGIQRLVVAGTCYEYGLQNGALNEDQFTDPVNCYAIAKDSLRRFIATHYNQQDLQWCWLRIFYPYGPGQNPKSLLPSLLQAIQAGEREFPMGSGRQLRDFIPVETIARQLLTLATNPQANGVYNGGSGIARSILDIAEEFVEAHGSSIVLKRGAYPDRHDEPLAFWASMHKLNSLSPFSPTIQ